ncbi:MAG: hypothetical protein Q4D41_05350 [Prevotellaceae bacterium]|nr:hypothetical protein [Prevotellaceae bacterium]
MKATINISDKVFEKLMAKGINGTINGKIGYISPTEVSFTVNQPRPKSKYNYKRLSHGRASENEDNVNLTLRIRLDEAYVNPVEIIREEAEIGIEFITARLRERTGGCR